MPEALLVNPMSADDVSETIKLALDMPLAERKRRHAALLASVRDEHVGKWSDDFITSLASRAVEEPEVADAR